MTSIRDEGPVYYREVQKNAYLKRIPNETGGGKLRPLGQKKPPLKPMWTLLCVHNGRIPFLEQYPDADSPSTLAHKPSWRVSLRTARHVTGSVRPHANNEHDFLVDTDHGPVRMLAPDWDTMQDWVSTLRNKLHELRILSKGENVYMSPPAAPIPRAGTRDPTSPLPPTPPVPPDRVPGIELTPVARPPQPVETTDDHENSHTEESPTITTTTGPNQSALDTDGGNIVNRTDNQQSGGNIGNMNDNQQNGGNIVSRTDNQQNGGNIVSRTDNQQSTGNIVNRTDSQQSGGNIVHRTDNQQNGSNIANSVAEENIDISNWDMSFSSLPSTSQVVRLESRKSVTKICGQNICLDDSILKRTTGDTETDSDEEFFTEIDRINNSIETIDYEDKFDYKHRVVVNTDKATFPRDDKPGPPQSTNVTVIKVSNKDPPHTAIPVLGPETDVFDFEFKQNRFTIEPDKDKDFVNIVNTENGYGTVFTEESDYGHVSLATTVNVNATDVSATSVTLTADVKSDAGLYERLCMASTSADTATAPSPMPVRKIRAIDKIRKSSLPNLDLESNTESAYEYLYPNNNNNRQNGEINSNVQRPTGQVPLDPITRAIRSSVERSRSQNAYDNALRARQKVVGRNAPKIEAKTEKPEALQAKPIWKRGLTELSLLTKLRGMTQTKRQDSPTRQDNGHNESVVTSQVKVIHRPRPETRVDSSRRRSNSFSNGEPSQQAALTSPRVGIALQPLRRRQAAALRAEQRRGAAVPASLPVSHPPLLVDYDEAVWVAWWGAGGVRVGGRVGDRVVGVRGSVPRDATHARQLIKNAHTHMVDILFHRVPLAKIYVVNKRDRESLGVKLDNDCNISSVESNSPAGRVALPTLKWSLTEVNNRPINLLKGGEEEMNRIAMNGTEVSLLIQPSGLIKKIRAAIKSNKNVFNLR